MPHRTTSVHTQNQAKKTKKNSVAGRTLATNAFWSLLSHVLHRGSLMLAAIILARHLEPQGFAAYSYFQMTIAMLATYAAMGLGTTASRFFAEFGNKETEYLSPIGTLLSLSAAMGVVAFWIVLSLPTAWLHSGLPVPQWLIALGVGMSVMGVVPSGGILGLEKYRNASFISLLSGIVMLGMTWLAVQRHSSQLGMWGLVAGISVQVIGQLLVILLTVGWQHVRMSCRWTWHEISKLAGFAGPMFLVSILMGSSTWIVGRLILAGSNELEFAAYSIGLQWFALGLLLPSIVSRVFLPVLVRNRENNVRRLVRLGALMALAPALLIATGGLIFAPWIIQLYGDQYSVYAYAIPAFLGVAVLYAPINTVGNAILAKNGQVIWLLFTIVYFTCLIATLLLAPFANVFWSCIAHFIAVFLMIVIVLAYGSWKRIV